jgi:uncharacterized protein DUF4154
MIPVRRSGALTPLFLLIAAVVCASATASAAPPDDEPSALERRVKAAFLYKFAAYVTWPQPMGPDSAFTIGVCGDDLLAAELGRVVAGRSVDGRRVVIRHVEEDDPLEGLQMLFISRARTDHLSSMVETGREHSVLTVTEAEGALAMGSVINFVLSGGKVRFEISLGAARRSGLSLSSRLLGVALSVIDEKEATP